MKLYQISKFKSNFLLFLKISALCDNSFLFIDKLYKLLAELKRNFLFLILLILN